MFRTDLQVKRVAAVTSILLLAVAEAMAQERTGRAPRRIVVSIPDCKLAVVDAGRVLQVFDTAVGAPASPSPAGTYTVVERLTDPTWYHKGQVVGPGKNNPVGPRWIGLNLKGYGIHGTNQPRSIGKAASHGCIRLKNQDIVALFELVAVGDTVELVGQRTEEVARLFTPVVLTAEAGGNN